MVKILSRIAVAAALVATAASSHAYIRLGVNQIGSGQSFFCLSSDFTGCGTQVGFSDVNGDGSFLVYTFNADIGGAFAGNQIFTVTKETGVEDIVEFSGRVGDYLVSQTNATSNSPGTSLEAISSTTALRVSRTAEAFGGDFFVGVRAFDFASPVGEEKTIFGSSGMSSTGNGSPTSMLEATFWADANNAGGAPLATRVRCNYLLSADDSCSTETKIWEDAAGSGGGLFSLRSEYTLNLAVGEGIEGTTTVIVRNVPEPMTLSLVGAALLGAAAAARRRANKA